MKILLLFVLLTTFLVSSGQPSDYVAGTQVCWEFNGRPHGYFHPAGTVDVMFTLIHFTGNGEDGCGDFATHAPENLFTDLGINDDGKWTLSDGRVFGIRVFTLPNFGEYWLAPFSTDITYFFENTSGINPVNYPNRIWYAGLSGGVNRMWGILANDPGQPTNNPYRTYYGGTINLSNCAMSAGSAITAASAGRRHWVWSGSADTQCPPGPAFPNYAGLLYGLLDPLCKNKFTLQPGTGHDPNTWNACWNPSGTTATTNRWLWMFNESEGEPKISLKVFLQGPYSSTTGLMNDGLRSASLIPTTEPYSSMSQFTHMGGGGGEKVSSSVFASTGTAGNDIVDWVFVQLHDPSTTAVIATRSALIQRDGDIVEVDCDGTIQNYVSFKGQNPGNYYVSVRHRNHLGVRTANTVTLSGTSVTSYDFTTALTQAYAGSVSNDPMATLATGAYGMWGGNANSDLTTRSSGSATINDYSLLLNYLGENLIISNVYAREDFNMDGDVRRTGSASVNDYSKLLSILGEALIITQPSF